MTTPLDPLLAEAVSPFSDEEIVKRVLEGDTAVFELIVRRYNQRLFRATRAILRDDGEAEDVMQEAYVRAFVNLGSVCRRREVLDVVNENRSLRSARTAQARQTAGGIGRNNG